MSDYNDFNLGTNWNRLTEGPAPDCVRPAAQWSRLKKLNARAFKLTSVDQITTKLTGSLGLKIDTALIKVEAAAGIESSLATTDIDEVYVIVASFREQQGVAAHTLLNPIGPCTQNGGVGEYLASCGSDFIGKVVHGGLVFIWVNAADLGVNLDAIRAQFGPLDESVDIPGSTFFNTLPSGAEFNVYSELGSLGGTTQVLTTPDILDFFDEIFTTADAASLGSPAFGRLETYLERAPLNVIEACSGATGLSLPKWECLHTNFANLSDFVNQSGYQRSLNLLYEEAQVVLDRIAANPDDVVFALSTQQLCDDVRGFVEDRNNDPNTEPCAEELYAFVRSQYLECRTFATNGLQACINAVASGSACDLVEQVYPAACQLSSQCQLFQSVAAEIPPPLDKGTEPPGARANRRYQFRGGVAATTRILEPASDSMCFLTDFNGLFDSDQNYIDLKVDGGDWTVQMRTATGGIDRTRFPSIGIECVDLVRFRSSPAPGTLLTFTTGRYDALGYAPGTYTANLANILPSPNENNPSFAAIGRFGGRWQHWDDRVFVDASAPPTGSYFDFTSISGGTKDVSVNWFAAEPDLTFRASFPASSPLSAATVSLNPVVGSEWVQTAGVPNPQPALLLPVNESEGICFLNGVGGEFVTNEDLVSIGKVTGGLASTNPFTGTYFVRVSSGYNTIDRRDIWARAQCILYQ